MTICLIDGDTVAYLSCKSRYRNAAGYIQIDLEKPVFTPEQDALYLETSWINMQQMIKEVCEASFTDEFKMAVKGEGNFRNDIYPEYKAHRCAQTTKNEFVPELRRRAVEAGLAIYAHGMEADDQIRIWQQECVAEGKQYVICREDKDLTCIPGRHYHLKKNEFLDISESEATRFFYEQLLQGDPTDNIKGIPKVGPVKAKAKLKNCNSEDEFQVAVQLEYMDYFQEKWREELILNGSLLYLKKSLDDSFTIEGWPYVEFIPKPPEGVIVMTMDEGVNFLASAAIKEAKSIGIIEEKSVSGSSMFRLPE